jgi:hypothetical protein
MIILTRCINWMNKKVNLNALLNQSGIREALRKQFPKIDKLESLDGLRNLRLIGIDARDDDTNLLLFYEAVATEDFYSHVRTRLIDEGVGSEDNIIVKAICCKGTSNEYERVMLSTNDFQAFLKVYNPSYEQGL